MEERGVDLPSSCCRRVLMERIRIVGNDLELDDKKVARIFDISSVQMHELRELLDKANDYDTKVEEAYEEGKQHHVYTKK